MRPKPLPPCKPDCSKRKVGCRSECDGWQKYQAEYDLYIAEKAKEAGYRSDLFTFEMRRLKRCKRKRR